LIRRHGSLARRPTALSAARPAGVGRRLVLALLAAAAAGCGDDAPRQPPPPNIVVIVLDTVRADHLGCYGYRRDTTPAIDAFARGSTLYSRAVATAPWTIPSHASLLTGLFPYEHGAHRLEPLNGRETVRGLDPAIPTLAELLAREGYVSGAFLANPYLSTAYGLHRGFAFWQIDATRAEKLNRRIVDWLADAPEAPFLLLVNYLDAHRVYNTDGRRSFLGPADPADRGESLERLKHEVLPGTRDAAPDLVQRVVDEYDTAIANLDDAVGELLAELDELELLENTVVVVTSDHGESFGEHRVVEHAKDVYQTELAIPLIVKQPGQRRGARIDTLVSLADVGRLAFAGLPSGPRERLLAAWPPPTGVAVAENHYTLAKDLADPRWGHRFRRIRRALFDGTDKFIESSDGAHELYDLAADPAELENRFDAEPELAARLRSRLAALLAAPRRAASAGENVEPDEELRAKLKALGYL